MTQCQFDWACVEPGGQPGPPENRESANYSRVGGKNQDDDVLNVDDEDDDDYKDDDDGKNADSKNG